MAASTLLSRAKQGDAAAIARLINQQLQPRGVTVLTSRRGSCLRLKLEADTTVPSKASFVAYIQQALTRLACPHIKRVEILALHSAQTRPSWYTALELERSLDTPVESPVHSSAPSPGSAPPVIATQSPPSHPVETPLVESASSPGFPQTRRPLPARWVIALQWFLASMGGLVLALGLLSLIAVGILPIISSLTGTEKLNGFAMALLFGMLLILGMPIAGLMVGHTQTRMLRRYIRGVSGWQLITPLGLSLGFLLAVITHFVGHTAFSLAGLTDSLGQATGSTGEWLSLGCTTLSIGLGCGFLGLSQYAILSGQLRYAQRWIAFSGASGMGAWLVGWLLFSLARPLWVAWASSFNLTPTLFGILASSLLGWILFQGSLAVALARLIRPNAEVTSPSTIITSADIPTSRPFHRSASHHSASQIQSAPKPLAHVQS